ncbi:uncharacterized protein LACBIDRAFT_324473 [Laccaria bicolor S238N-H82]|uniref:Predicted protein n=1 Tax=Laccaria bicolor (strain S238N-H82 / ATCC MYA-4686) TaxID=486041 RepID=B0D1X8_LACBS|nr:uncharacterized protein LACBIDRAFT_324473 [Laccaria bicolor S238N-H82]EDR12069.1 predicted protein [Laccaria bicolor S238N-H82]|eukprot:XP_001877966.1 predicted protein [Laccaria bicolor S238N-H82]
MVSCGHHRPQTSSTTNNDHINNAATPRQQANKPRQGRGDENGPRGTTTTTMTTPTNHDTPHDINGRPRQTPTDAHRTTTTPADDHVNAPPPQRTTTTPADDHINAPPPRQWTMTTPTDTHVNARRRAPADGKPRCHVAVSDVATKLRTTMTTLSFVVHTKPPRHHTTTTSALSLPLPCPSLPFPAPLPCPSPFPCTPIPLPCPSPFPCTPFSLPPFLSVPPHFLVPTSFPHFIVSAPFLFPAPFPVPPHFLVPAPYPSPSLICTK